MNGYSARKVCALSGASYRQVESWTRAGLVRASVQEGFQSGHRRLYSFEDAVQVAVIREVSAAMYALPVPPIPTSGVWQYAIPSGWTPQRVGLASLRVDVAGIRLDVTARASRDGIVPAPPYQGRSPRARFTYSGPLLCEVCHTPLIDHVTGVYCRLTNRVGVS